MIRQAIVKAQERVFFFLLLHYFFYHTDRAFMLPILLPGRFFDFIHALQIVCCNEGVMKVYFFATLAA